MGVAPWDLEKRRIYYRDRALSFEKAESRAVEIAREIEKARSENDSETD
jgi:hypothetical protein